MKYLRRLTIVEVVVALLIVLAIFYFFERRFPSWQERRKMSQAVVASFDNMELQDALQALIDQTDGTVTITVCSGLTKSKVSLHSNGPIALNGALKGIAARIPAKYYPYGLLDVAVAHPVFLCQDRNETAVTIKKGISKL